MSKKPYDPRISKRVGLLVIATLPIAALLGIVVLKLLFMMLFAQVSIGQAAAGDYKSALATARWNLIVNVVDPWRAHYNVGTAQLGLELYDDSRNSLSYALQSAPLPDACFVRTNLALAIEGQGDLASENDEFEDAVDFYAQAVAMLKNMPKECESESESESSSDSGESESGSGEESESESDSGGTLGEQSEESQERLGEKGEQAESDLEEQQRQQQAEQESGGQTEGQGDAEGESEAPADSPLDDLGDRMDEAEQDRTDWDSVDRSQNAPFELPDKPW